MTSGGGAYPWVNVQYSTAGFNHVCSPLCSTTCLSGGYPVTLICWHYTKHWSLSTCSYFKKYGLKQYFMWRRTLSARQRPLPLLLLYNYLITNNTLQLFCDSPSPFVGVFFFFFWNIWILQTLYGLKKWCQGRGRWIRGQQGMTSHLATALLLILSARDVEDAPPWQSSSWIRDTWCRQKDKHWSGMRCLTNVGIFILRQQPGLLWVTGGELSPYNKGLFINGRIVCLQE